MYNKVEGSMILVLGLHNGGMTLLTIADLLNYHPFVIFGIVILIVTAIIPLTKTYSMASDEKQVPSTVLLCNRTIL